MAINRNSLMLAIIAASRAKNYDTYYELLDIYYKLLEQEDINDNYIEEFTSYNTISEDAQNLIGSVPNSV